MNPGESMQIARVVGKLETPTFYEHRRKIEKTTKIGFAIGVCLVVTSTPNGKVRQQFHEDFCFSLSTA